MYNFFFSIDTFFIHLLVYQILYLHYVYNFFYTIIYNIIYSILEKLHFAFQTVPLIILCTLNFINRFFAPSTITFVTLCTQTSSLLLTWMEIKNLMYKV